MNYKSFSDLSSDIVSNLHKLYHDNYDLVVGIPRSGMIPAYMIGLYLNINVTDLDSLVENRKITSGSTRNPRFNIKNAWDAKNILLVDDSVVFGQAMTKALKKIPEELKDKTTTLAIYSSLKSRHDVDIFFEFVPIPRVFEWNIFHRDLMNRACLDIDGVLCEDPPDEYNDDGEKYIDFILNAKPLFIPSSKVKALVTSRLEKYRKQTELWLQKHGVEYDQLIMLDLPSKEERQRLSAHVSHKSSYYVQSKLELFVESEPKQALKIMQVSGKSVFCTGDNKMYAPGMMLAIRRSPLTVVERIKNFAAARMPENVRKIVKPFYKSVFR